MDVTRNARASFSMTNVFVILLGVSILLGAWLTLQAFAPPGSGAAFAVTSMSGMACPSDQGSPVCFRAVVNDTGNEAAIVRCELTPATGTTATFFSGSPVYTSAAAFQPGRPLPLSIQVDVTDGSTTVEPPSLSCAPASG